MIGRSDSDVNLRHLSKLRKRATRYMYQAHEAMKSCVWQKGKYENIVFLVGWTSRLQAKEEHEQKEKRKNGCFPTVLHSFRCGIKLRHE